MRAGPGHPAVLVRATLVAAALVVPVAACGTPSKEKRCERFADESLGAIMAIANGLGDKLGGGDAPDIALEPKVHGEVRAKAIAECMTWPDDYVACMTDGDFDSPECKKAVAAKEGTVVAETGATGPEPTVRKLGADDGLEAYGDRALIGTSDDIKQTAEGDPFTRGNVVGLVTLEGERVWLVSYEGLVNVFATERTSARASRLIAKVSAPRKAPDDPVLTPLAASPKGLVVFEDGLLRRLTPPLSEACEGCWTTTPWSMADSYGSLSWSDRPVLDDIEGGVVARVDTRLRVFAGDAATPRFVLRSRENVGLVKVVGDTLYVGAGKLALALGPACASDGELTIEDGALEALPAGCIKGRFELPEPAYGQPVRAGDATYFLAGGRVHQMRADGTKGWVADIEGNDLLALERGGKTRLVGATMWTMDHPARVVVLDPESGRTLMQIDLPGSEMTMYDVVLARDGDALLAETSKRLYRWDIAALAAAFE